MRQLYLVRHAKSDWAHEGLPDIDRPLNARGYADAPRMARRLANQGVAPDLVLSSPAVRALSTALIFARELGYSPRKLALDERLYETPSRDVLAVIAAQPDAVRTLMVFAHNPTLSHVASALTGTRLDMPTCAIVCVSAETTSWQRLVDEGGELRAFEYPKKTD